jgi:two-component system, OmpR family, alkaline phosphatase synthesis response regulator PhoP
MVNCGSRAMANVESKILVFGKLLAGRLLEIANLQNLTIIDSCPSSFAYETNQPVIAVIDALSIDNQQMEFKHCVRSRDRGYPIAILGVLTDDVLGKANDIRLKAINLSMYNDFLLLPSNAFELTVRLARCKQIAHTTASFINPKFSIGPITFNVQSVSVDVKGKNLRLTRKETELLLFMARNANEVISKEKIAQSVWNIASPTPSFENLLNAHLVRLRKKLGRAGCWGLLRTVRGAGLEFSTLAANFHNELLITRQLAGVESSLAAP